MYVAVECKCGSTVNIDSEWEESAWMMMFRFADAHVRCGTFTKTAVLPERIEIEWEEPEDEPDDADEGDDEAVA